MRSLLNTVRAGVLMAACAVASAQAQTPSLLDLAANADAAAIRAAITQGGDANMRGAAGQTPLMIAALHGNVAAIEALLAAGAEIDAHGPAPDFRFGPRDYAPELGNCSSALTLAAAAGRRRAVEVLIGRGANSSCIRTGLLSLAIIGRAVETDEQVALVTWLMERESVTPFQRSVAFFVRHPRISALVQADIDTSDRSVMAEMTMTGLALESAYSELFVALGDASIWEAAAEGDTARIDALLAGGADVNARDDRSHGTPLMRATVGDDVSAATAVITFLLDRGAEINAVDSNGETALMKAAGLYGPSAAPLVSALLARGADRALRNQRGEDAMAMARRTRNREVQNALRAR